MTGALIPVHINAIASAGSLDVPGPVGDYYAPIEASTGAQVSVQYAEGDVPVGADQNGSRSRDRTDHRDTDSVEQRQVGNARDTKTRA